MAQAKTHSIKTRAHQPATLWPAIKPDPLRVAAMLAGTGLIRTTPARVRAAFEAVAYEGTRRGEAASRRADGLTAQVCRDGWTIAVCIDKPGHPLAAGAWVEERESAFVARVDTGGDVMEIIAPRQWFEREFARLAS